MAKTQPLPTMDALAPQLEAMCKSLTYLPGIEATALMVANRLYQNVGRYIAMANEIAGGVVPAVFYMVAHERESSGNWNTYLGNGDPLNRATVDVPVGRGPFATFEEGAKDAIFYEGLDKSSNWNMGSLAYRVIGFNGWGYFIYHGIMASPYAFAGSTLQQRGKYVADGQYDATAWDSQIGGMLIYDQLCKLDPGLALP